jgi:hypothetical protein
MLKRIVFAIIGLSVPIGPAGAKAFDLTPAMSSAFFAAIVSNDFNCPTVKMASTKRADVYGDVFRVWCGPDDGTTDVFGDSFRVTLTPSDKFIVAPWDQ